MMRSIIKRTRDKETNFNGRSLPLSIQNDLIAQTVDINWNPLFDIAKQYNVKGSDIKGVKIGNLPPGPYSDPPKMSGKSTAPSDLNALAISSLLIMLLNIPRTIYTSQDLYPQ